MLAACYVCRRKVVLTGMEHIHFQIFRTCVAICLALVLLLIWFESYLPDVVQKLVPTFFIIGFANALWWGGLVTYRFLRALER